MPRYRFPHTSAEIFFRQGRRLALEARLSEEGIESIGALLGKAPFRAVSLLVQDGVDKGGNGGPPTGDEAWAPAITLSDANTLIDTALEQGATITDLGSDLVTYYLGNRPEKKDDGGAANGPAPPTT